MVTVQYWTTLAPDCITTAMKKLHHATIRAFRRRLYTHFDEHGRSLPWRDLMMPPDSWRVFVSEVMLQQTQVDRVVPKFEQFFAAFPTACDLATAAVDKLLPVWKGLGYNRRALNLQRSARIISDEYGGSVPCDRELLLALPGIGPATARSIMVYAFNAPEVFIETNVRSVYLHTFFEDRSDVHDDEISPLVEQTLDREAPAKFYSALMDYGTQLKKGGNPNRRSRHYTRQSQFEGSNRQLRSRMLSAALAVKAIDAAELARKLDADQEAVERNLAALCREGFLCEERARYSVAGNKKRG